MQRGQGRVRASESMVPVCRSTYGTKLLLKPSRKNVRMFLAKIDDVIQHAGGHLTAGDLIERLNPKIRGWALYHRHASSKRTFAHVDDGIWKRLWHWARRRHRAK